MFACTIHSRTHTTRTTAVEWKPSLNAFCCTNIDIVAFVPSDTHHILPKTLNGGPLHALDSMRAFVGSRRNKTINNTGICIDKIRNESWTIDGWFFDVFFCSFAPDGVVGDGEYEPCHEQYVGFGCLFCGWFEAYAISFSPKTKTQSALHTSSGELDWFLMYF